MLHDWQHLWRSQKTIGRGRRRQREFTSPFLSPSSGGFFDLLRNNKGCFRSCPSLRNAVLRERRRERRLEQRQKMVSVLKQKSSVGGKPSFCVLLSLCSLLTVSQIFIRGILHPPPPQHRGRIVAFNTVIITMYRTVGVTC